jgi:hypothetical protein
MSDYQVTCITPDSADTDRRIDRLGGIRTSEGGTWNDSIDNVIAAIGNGHTFWVSVQNRRVGVYRVIHPVSRRWYLTTDPDGFLPNNLLNLPRCP